MSESLLRYTCVFAGLLIVRVSAALYLCIRWIAYCPSLCCVIPVYSLDCLLSRYIHWIEYCPSMHTCAFAGCVLSKYPLLHLCFRIKYQSIRVKKEKKKFTTATTTGLPIVRVSVIPLHSLDCLLSTYLLCMSVRWTVYCASIRYTSSLHSTGILIVRVCDIPVHSLDCIMFLLSIC